MFENLDGFTQNLLSKLSNKELANFASNPNNYPLIAPYVNDTQFWADLCLSRFGMRPYQSENAKQFFRGEALYAADKFHSALELQSFRAFQHYIAEEIAQQNYEKALNHAQKMQLTYGAAGGIHILQVCETAIRDPGTLAQIKQEFAGIGITVAEGFELTQLDEASQFYLESLGFQWKEIEKFKRNLLANFEIYMSRSPASFKV